MADLHDENFESTQSGASQTIPQQCSALRKGGFVMIKNRPCKIVEMSTSKTGKHGHAKVHMVALDVFTGKKYEDICPSTHNMNVPIVKRLELMCCDFVDGMFHLMTDDGEMREDLKLTDMCTPNKEEEIKKMLEDQDKGNAQVWATTLAACGEEVVKEVKLKGP